MWSQTGRLCADVEIESNYKGDGLFVEGWTFKSDEAAMRGFWFLQSGMLTGMCFYGRYMRLSLVKSK